MNRVVLIICMAVVIIVASVYLFLQRNDLTSAISDLKLFGFRP
jgi:hypothetical protein